MESKFRPSDDGRAWVEIDLAALEHNAAEICAHLPKGCELIAIIKADAYGHGIEKCGRRLYEHGVRVFGVATIVEGIRLRKELGDAGIIVLGYTHPKDAWLLSEYSISQTLVDGVHARALNETGHKISVHIEVDTGMHRLGFRPGGISEIERVYACENLRVDGIATHLSSSDSLGKDDMRFTNFQIKRFFSLIETLKNKGYNVGKLHAQASYGIFNFPQLRFDYSRAGISLYGLMSSNGALACMPELRPVLSLRALIVQVRWIGAGERVSYGKIFTSGRPMKIATCSIGYADGVPRQMSGNGGMGIVRGHKVAIIGRICMDMLMVDITDVDGVCAGDIITLIGSDGDETIRCEDFAAASGTITNDILCRLGGRLPRIFKD